MYAIRSYYVLDDLVARQRHAASEEGADPAAVDEARLRTEARSAAERQVRRMLLLDAIAKDRITSYNVCYTKLLRLFVF